EAARDGQFGIGLFHVVGPSIASLEEIGEISRYIGGIEYIIARNFINETSFFEWDQKTHKKYFPKGPANEMDVPRLNEMAFEQVDLAGVTFDEFIDNKGADGEPGNFSFVLRGYVRKWRNDLEKELEQLKLLKGLVRGRPAAAA